MRSSRLLGEREVPRAKEDEFVSRAQLSGTTYSVVQNLVQHRENTLCCVCTKVQISTVVHVNTQLTNVKNRSLKYVAAGGNVFKNVGNYGKYSKK